MSFKGKFSFFDMGKHVLHELRPSILSAPPHNSSVFLLYADAKLSTYTLQDAKLFLTFLQDYVSSVWNALAILMYLLTPDPHSRFSSSIISS